MNNKPFRRGIVAVFINDSDELLVGKRFGSVAAWQFPQGGIDPGEEPQQALKREAFEEVGVKTFSVLKSIAEPIRYHFPPGMKGKVAVKYQGQDLYWFLCKLDKGQRPDLALASDQEFDELAWVSPQRAYEGVIAWKRESYLKALSELGFKLKKA